MYLDPQHCPFDRFLTFYIPYRTAGAKSHFSKCWYRLYGGEHANCALHKSLQIFSAKIARPGWIGKHQERGALANQLARQLK